MGKTQVISVAVGAGLLALIGVGAYQYGRNAGLKQDMGLVQEAAKEPPASPGTAPGSMPTDSSALAPDGAHVANFGSPNSDAPADSAAPAPLLPARSYQPQAGANAYQPQPTAGTYQPQPGSTTYVHAGPIDVSVQHGVAPVPYNTMSGASSVVVTHTSTPVPPVAPPIVTPTAVAQAPQPFYHSQVVVHHYKDTGKVHISRAVKHTASFLEKLPGELRP